MFKVNPQAVREAANDYMVCAAHLSVAGTYHQEPSQVEFFEKSLLQLLEPGHLAFAAQLQQRLEQAGLVLSDSGTGLLDAAQIYESTDEKSAGELDAVYPGIDRSKQRKDR